MKFTTHNNRPAVISDEGKVLAAKGVPVGELQYLRPGESEEEFMLRVQESDAPADEPPRVPTDAELAEIKKSAQKRRDEWAARRAAIAKLRADADAGEATAPDKSTKRKRAPNADAAGKPVEPPAEMEESDEPTSVPEGAPAPQDGEA